eukprot:gene4788-6353_t
MLALLMLCALMLVNAQYQTRRLFIELERAQQRQREHEIEWSQLQLEQSLLAKHARIDALAKTAGRGVPFSPSPVLAVKLPAWRSKLVMFILFVAFATLAGRAFWLQALTTDFLQKKGASRYARTLELPATRGKILD